MSPCFSCYCDALWLDHWTWESEYMSMSRSTILIGMCGSMDDAILVFRQMRRRDTQTWSVMIVAYAMHGHGSRAVSMLEEMKKEKVQPDEITFVASQWIGRGRLHFHSMTNEYGIVPHMKHYGGMVDLLGRAGCLDEAYKFIDELPIEPTLILWRRMLSTCSSHGNVEMEKQLDDSHGGDYVVLSNLCARYGKWEDVNFLRKNMVDKGAVNIPGCSSIEVNNIVHVFFSGDGVHSTSTALHHALDKLLKELKLAGYVPDTSLVFHADMDDEEREIILRYHINTPPGTTICCHEEPSGRSYLETCSNFIISKMGNVPVGITDPGQWHKGGAWLLALADI
ncbi:hypothetical protein Ahy_B05g077468 [Arachis hypogaea]|uniref:Uncharacterized protein n=1 Tax=Arachis hypogaea TaxID=3818 RepID=A0A444Z4Y3_ARAHY|nr:hypothetical protein Ahy_B05g077468 [Arachis hypogaea]